MVCLVEILCHATRSEKLAVEAISPLMIRAHQPRRTTVLFETDFRAAVAATVPECANFVVASTQYDDGVTRQLKHEIIARIFYMRDGAGI